MFIKRTRSGSREYIQLVEAYRDEAGKAKQRTLATLGRVEDLQGTVDSVIAGLLKVTGRDPMLLAPPKAASVRFEPARALGDVWALTHLWKELGFQDLRRTFRRTRHSIDVEALVRIMVINRLCDPESKLGVLRWLETVALPDIDIRAVTHQHLLRSMDALVNQQEEVDAVVAGLLRPLVDQDLSVVFYDLTTIRAEGGSTQDADVRKFGMSKEGIIARQFMVGVVQTAEGIPLHHEVFDGNTSETATLLPTVRKILARFPSLKRVVLVADRGLLSLDNLEALRALQVRDGQPVEFILAVPGRRYGEFSGLLADFQTKCHHAAEEIVGDLTWNGLRLVVAHDPVRAQEQSELRKARLADLEKRAEEYAQKLEAQSAGIKARGRKLSSSGAKARVYHHVADAHLLKILKVDTASDLFSYDLDETALAKAELMDGKLLLVTNVADLRPEQVIERYKSLADIERGFKVLKSEIEIGPVYHRLPQRIRAHAMICFMALILHRVMRLRLREAKSSISPERALAALQRIQQHQVTIDQQSPLRGVSTLSGEQSAVLKALNVPRPTDGQQLTLL